MMDELKCLAGEFRSALEARLSGDPAGECSAAVKGGSGQRFAGRISIRFSRCITRRKTESPQASHFEEELELLAGGADCLRHPV